MTLQHKQISLLAIKPNRIDHLTVMLHLSADNVNMAYPDLFLYWYIGLTVFTGHSQLPPNQPLSPEESICRSDRMF